MQITLPHNWTPRAYQLPVLSYLDNGGKRAVSVWARRHGKDVTAINYTAKAAFQRVGTYWHVYPTLRQARKAIWDGFDIDGRRIIHQAFPGADKPGTKLVTKVREDDMKIELIAPPGQNSGSVWQLVGADNYDALVGSNPIGIVLSEWALMDPKVWDFLRPIVRANGGWVWFIYTPRGRNHGWDIIERARRNPDRWFSEVIDIEKAGVLDPIATIKEEREDGMPEELILQEYFCSFDVGVVGAIFAKEIDRAKNEARIGEVPYDPNFPVETSWDLGYRDATAIWFFQRVGQSVRAIDYYEASGQKLQHYIDVLHAKGYVYSRHIGPFDLNKPELGSGHTIKETAQNFGIEFEIAHKLLISDGINASRAIIHKTTFDAARCAAGLKSLENYKFTWDEEKRIFSKEPEHDWASHGASAFRYYAVTPALDFVMPQWLQDMSPVFGGRVPADKQWNSRTGKSGVQPAIHTPEKRDPLAAFRGAR